MVSIVLIVSGLICLIFSIRFWNKLKNIHIKRIVDLIGILSFFVFIVALIMGFLGTVYVYIGNCYVNGFNELGNNNIAEILADRISKPRYMYSFYPILNVIEFVLNKFQCYFPISLIPLLFIVGLIILITDIRNKRGKNGNTD